MSRLERRIKRSGLDEIAEDAGWHKIRVDNASRSVTYYKGPSYVKIKFTAWLYDIDNIYWWDDKSNCGNVYSRKHEDLFLELLLLDIFDGKIDPTDKESILKYITI